MGAAKRSSSIREIDSPVRLRALTEEEKELGLWEPAGRNEWKSFLLGYTPLRWEREEEDYELEDEGLPLDLLELVVLTGPARSGKRTLLSGLEGELQDAGYHRLLLDLPAMSEEELDAAAAEFARLNERDTVIRLEHVGQLKGERLERLLQAFSGESRWILTAALDDGAELDPALAGYFACFRVSLPTEDDRIALLRSVFSRLPRELEMHFRRVTKETDYGMLNSLLKGMRLQFRSEMREKSQRKAERIIENFPGGFIDVIANRLPPKIAEQDRSEERTETSPELSGLVRTVAEAFALRGMRDAAQEPVPQEGAPAETKSAQIDGPVVSVDDIISSNDNYEQILDKLNPEYIDKVLNVKSAERNREGLLTN